MYIYTYIHIHTYTVRSKSSRTKVIKTKKKESGYFFCLFILHLSAATSPSGIGSSRGETNLASLGVGSMLRLVFESETVELLLPNAPGR